MIISKTIAKRARVKTKTRCKKRKRKMIQTTRKIRIKMMITVK